MGNTPLTGPKNIGQFAEHNLELPSGELKLGEDFERKLELSVGAPEEIRTPDPQIRSLVLYPAELRARVAPHGINAAEAALQRAA
jgi:hypothetical protein